MLDAAISFLRCPQCAHEGALARAGQSLRRVGQSLRCAAGHTFDIARSGYVGLLPPGPLKTGGDTAAMVAARQDFLAAGHFAGLAAVLADMGLADMGLADMGLADMGLADMPSVGHVAPGCVVDVGAGPGYYLAAMLDRLPGRVGLALDVSKSALKLAARAHPRITAIGCDAWRPLPVGDRAAGLVLNVFAPRDAAELARIMAPGGRLLVGTPAADHLAELIGPLSLLTVGERKQAKLARTLRPYFHLDDATEYRATLLLGHQAVAAAVAMGPSSWHAEPAILADRIGQLANPLKVTAAVRITSWRPLPR
jgi:23S rRNA (guanine745-N1)-methyltransferase